MKRNLLLLSVSLLSSGFCLAQDVGRVISSTPVVQQVGVPRQVCAVEPVNPQNCTTQVFYEDRAVAFNVVYEFEGKQYSVQMPSDPGASVQLQLAPVESGAPMAPRPDTVTYVQPVLEQPAYLVQAPAYPGYYQANYVWPFVLGLGFGYLGGGYGHGHGHWR